MIFSRANLEVRHAAPADKTDPALYRVQLEPDGSSVAADGHVVLAVGPPDPERASYFPDVGESHAQPPPEGVGVDPTLVATVARGMPAGKRPGLQFVQLTRCGETEVELMSTDGVRKTKRSCAPARRRFPRWRGALARAKAKATRGRVVVNGKSLRALLGALLRAAADPGKDNAVVIEFGGEDDALVLRAENVVCKQRVIGLATPLKVPAGELLKPDEWEEGVYASGAPKRRLRGRPRIR